MAFFFHTNGGSITFEENTQANLSTLNTPGSPTSVYIEPGSTVIFNG